MKNNNLDKFYTNPHIISKLIKEIDYVIKASNFSLDVTWVEPAAGSGNFIKVLKKLYSNVKFVAYDIEPCENAIIQKQDFLLLDCKFNDNNIVFGNPPFGKRSDTAIKFINKSFELSDIVAFILPNQFKKYLTQKNINDKAKLIKEVKLKPNIFILNNKEHSVNCVFQIWVNSGRREFRDFKNYRILNKPTIKHDDFKTFIHNNTLETLKYFDKKFYNWDYAVTRQGYYDYVLITNPEKLKKNIQYFFIKCNVPECHKVIKNINFKKLSETNTTTPGFSTTDFVKEYKKIKNKLKILLT